MNVRSLKVRAVLLVALVAAVLMFLATPATAQKGSADMPPVPTRTASPSPAPAPLPTTGSGGIENATLVALGLVLVGGAIFAYDRSRSRKH